MTWGDIKWSLAPESAIACDVIGGGAWSHVCDNLGKRPSPRSQVLLLLETLLVIDVAAVDEVVGLEELLKFKEWLHNWFIVIPFMVLARVACRWCPGAGLVQVREE